MPVLAFPGISGRSCWKGKRAPAFGRAASQAFVMVSRCWGSWPTVLYSCIWRPKALRAGLRLDLSLEVEEGRTAVCVVEGLE